MIFNWGCQHATEALALAISDMPLDSFLQAWFPPHPSPARALKSDDAPRASCSVSNDTDMLGSGIAGGNIPHVTSTAKCCDLCAAHPDCRGWVLHPPHYAKDPATCFLKTSGDIKHTRRQGSDLRQCELQHWRDVCANKVIDCYCQGISIQEKLLGAVVEGNSLDGNSSIVVSTDAAGVYVLH